MNKRLLASRLQAYSDAVIAPRPAQYDSITLLNTIRCYRLQGVIALAGAMPAAEKLALYERLGHMADLAPSYAPCPLSTLDAYRYALDMGVAA